MIFFNIILGTNLHGHYVSAVKEDGACKQLLRLQWRRDYGFMSRISTLLYDICFTNVSLSLQQLQEH
jgi:hypothetical protein